MHCTAIGIRVFVNALAERSVVCDEDATPLLKGPTNSIDERTSRSIQNKL
jgi:hypothetical protein